MQLLTSLRTLVLRSDIISDYFIWLMYTFMPQYQRFSGLADVVHVPAADESISLHRLFGGIIGIATVGHVGCHVNNYIQLVSPAFALLYQVSFRRISAQRIFVISSSERREPVISCMDAVEGAL